LPNCAVSKNHPGGVPPPRWLRPGRAGGWLPTVQLVHSSPAHVVSGTASFPCPVRPSTPSGSSDTRVNMVWDRMPPYGNGLFVPPLSVFWAHPSSSVAFGTFSEHVRYSALAFTDFASNAWTVASLTIRHELSPLCMSMRLSCMATDSVSIHAVISGDV
jgi:hypothetical protein